MPEGTYGTDRDVRRIEGGRLELRCVHEVEGVSPEMMLWFFTHRTKERYQMWHPAHADFKVLGNGDGNHIGDVYFIDEVFEDGRTLAVKLRVTEADITEFAEQHVSWRKPGGISHKMERTSSGTRVRTSALFGTALPVLGPVYNYILRKFAYKPKMFKAAFLHMDEEFLHFPEFLPQLYAASAGDERSARPSRGDGGPRDAG